MHGIHETLTLRALMDEPLLRNASIQARQDDLDQDVAWCLPLAIIDRSDEPLAKVLVHSDSHFDHMEPAAIESLVSDLARRNAVALAVNDPPEGHAELREAGARHRLSILSLKSGTTYERLSRLVAEKTLAHQAHVLQYGVTVHQALGEVLYRGAGLGAMAQQMSSLTGCHVFILDPGLEILADRTDAVSPFEPARVLDRLREQLFSEDSTGQLANQRGAFMADMDLGGTTAACIAAPIVLGEATYGWVVLLEPEYPPRRHDVAQHLVVAEQGATISGSEMLRLRSVEAAEERARGDFAHALLHGRFTSGHELAARAAQHGFDVAASYGVIVAQGGFDTSTTAGLEQQNALLRQVYALGSISNTMTLATAVGDMLVVIRHLGSSNLDAGEPLADQDAVSRFAHLLAEEIPIGTGSLSRLAYGRPGIGSVGVASSYRDARIALGLAQRLGLTEVCGYSELRLYAALSDMTNSRQMLSFAEDVLAPLRASSRTAESLEKIVLAYIECGANLNAAARRLNLHRNTLYHKLDQASHLLHMDLRDADALFTVWLAHRVDALERVHAEVSDDVRLSTAVRPLEDG